MGPGFPVGVRLSSEEYIPGGLTPADTAEIARAVEPLVEILPGAPAEAPPARWRLAVLPEGQKLADTRPVR